MNPVFDAVLAACQIALLMAPLSMLRPKVPSPPKRECMWVSVPLFIMAGTLGMAGAVLGGVITGFSACIWTLLAVKSMWKSDETPDGGE